MFNRQPAGSTKVGSVYPETTRFTSDATPPPSPIFGIIHKPSVKRSCEFIAQKVDETPKAKRLLMLEDEEPFHITQLPPSPVNVTPEPALSIHEIWSPIIPETQLPMLRKDNEYSNTQQLLFTSPLSSTSSSSDILRRSVLLDKYDDASYPRFITGKTRGKADLSSYNNDAKSSADRYIIDAGLSPQACKPLQKQNKLVKGGLAETFLQFKKSQRIDVSRLQRSLEGARKIPTSPEAVLLRVEHTSKQELTVFKTLFTVVSGKIEGCEEANKVVVAFDRKAVRAKSETVTIYPPYQLLKAASPLPVILFPQLYEWL